MRTRRMAIKAAAVLLMIGLLLAPVAGLRAAPSVAVSATATQDAIMIQAQGFQAGEAVTAWLTGPREQVIGTTAYYETSEVGDVSFELSLRGGVEPGLWIVTIHGLDSQLEAYARFEVQASVADENDDDEDEDDEDSDTDGDGDTDGDSD